jgi:hypothetical protein
MITSLEDRSDNPHQESRRDLLHSRHSIEHTSQGRRDEIFPIWLVPLLL